MVNEKKFYIHDPEDLAETAKNGAKKFEITGSSPKTFIVHGNETPRSVLHGLASGETTNLMHFFRQNNTYDCGPCVILNTRSALGLPLGVDPASGINELRAQINAGRRSRGEREHAHNAWLQNFDVSSSLQSEMYTGPEYIVLSPQLADNNMREINAFFEGPDGFIVTTVGRHFRSIVKRTIPGQQTVYTLLDSFQSSPISMSIDQIRGYLSHVVEQSRALPTSAAPSEYGQLMFWKKKETPADATIHFRPHKRFDIT